MATKNFPTVSWGITAPQYRHPSRPRENLDINSKEDDKPVRINSREYDGDTADTIGGQTKPNQVADKTNRVVCGWEFSPRVTDAGLGATGAIIGLRADPLLKTATGARTVGSLRCIEMNPGLPGGGSAYTVTNLDAIRIFLDTGVGHTITTKSIIRIASPNNADWTYLLNFETDGGAVITAAVGGNQSKKLKIKVGATDFFIPLNDA